MPIPAPPALPVPVAPVAPAAVVPQAQTAATPAEAPVNKLPYDFWPQLPWSAEPTLPQVDLNRIRAKEDGDVQAWLGTEPHLPSGGDEAAWHGVKVLGVGGFGAVGLWVQSDETNHITNVC